MFGLSRHAEHAVWLDPAQKTHAMHGGSDACLLGYDQPRAAGELPAHAEQRVIAPTIVKLPGINPAEYKGATGSPIAAAFKP